MFKELTLKDYLDKISSNEPVPGGGTASAISGATSASLIAMVAELTIGKKGYEDHFKKMEEVKKQALAIKEDLTNLSEEDAKSYNLVFDCFKMPKETEEDKKKRSKAIQEATLKAALIPLEVAQKSAKLFDLAKEVVENGNKNAASDGGVAALLARAAVHGACFNVLINVGSLKDEEKRDELTKETNKLTDLADKCEAQIVKLTNLK